MDWPSASKTSRIWEYSTSITTRSGLREPETSQSSFQLIMAFRSYTAIAIILERREPRESLSVWRWWIHLRRFVLRITILVMLELGHSPKLWKRMIHCSLCILKAIISLKREQSVLVRFWRTNISCPRSISTTTLLRMKASGLLPMVLWRMTPFESFCCKTWVSAKPVFLRFQLAFKTRSSWPNFYWIAMWLELKVPGN